MNQFIIATNLASAIQRNAITNYLKSKGWAYWHHFEDLWMVAINDPDTITSQQLFNDITSIPVIGKQTYILIIRLPKPGQPMTHCGFGPTDGWTWTKEYWGQVG